MGVDIHEKVRCILADSDFNDLPYEERIRIGKYVSEQQILTLYQVLCRDKENTTATWRRKMQKWLDSCIRLYNQEYMQPNEKSVD